MNIVQTVTQKQCTESQYTNVYCNTIPSAARFLCHNTLQCIVIQISTIQPQYNRRLTIQFTHCTPKLQYTSPISIQFSSHSNPSLAIQFQQPSPLAIHLILQYNFPATQTLLLQYNSNSLAHLKYTSYCNTNLANLHSQSLSHNKIPYITIQLGSGPTQFCTKIFF